MYSVQSETHASKTKYPEGILTKLHPESYRLSRFRAFLQSDVNEAIESQHPPSSLLSSTSSTSDAPADPLIIPLTFTNTNALLAYSLTREAVMKLRSAQAWTYNETKEHKVTINMALVRAIFSQKSTVHKLIVPLHSDSEHTKPTANELPNYRMAFNFLTEIGLQAFRSDKGIYHATLAPDNCQDDYSGDLKPKATNNKGPITHHKNSPFPGQTSTPTNRDPSQTSKTNNQDLLTQSQALNNSRNDPTPRTLGNTATAAGILENTSLTNALNPTKKHVLLNLKLQRRASVKNT